MRQFQIAISQRRCVLLPMIVLTAICCATAECAAEGDEVEAIPAVKLTRPLAGVEDAPAEAPGDAVAKKEQATDNNRVPRAKLTRKIEGVLQPRAQQFRPIPAEPMILDIDPLDEAHLKKYMPALEQCLTLEIHFLRKLCNPTEEQLKPIRAAGEKKLFVLGTEFAKEGKGAFLFTEEGARDLLRKELLTAAKDVLNAEDLETYSWELELRNLACYRGIAELMTLHADSMLSFNVKQFDRVSQAIQKQPDPLWTRDMQSLFYKQHSPKPGVEILSPALNEKQRQMMRGQSQRTTSIWFGWLGNIGINQFGEFGDGFKIQELSSYDEREEQE